VVLLVEDSLDAGWIRSLDFAEETTVRVAFCPVDPVGRASCEIGMASPGVRNLAGSDDARPVASFTGIPFNWSAVPPFAAPLYDIGRMRLAVRSVAPLNTGAGSGVALVRIGFQESSDARNRLLLETFVCIFRDVAGSVEPLDTSGTEVAGGDVRL